MRKVALALLAAALAGGCVSARREAAPLVYRSAERQDLLALYNSNAAKISTLTADLRMVVHYQADNSARQYRVSAWLDVQKPGKLRLTHDSLGRDLFFILADGHRYWIALDAALAGGKDTVYTGTLGAPAKKSFLQPDGLLAAFSLAPLPPEGTAETFFQEFPDLYVLTFVEGSAKKRIAAQAFFSRVDLRLSRYQVFDEESRLVLEVDYKSYTNAGGAEVPQELYISWPLDDFSVLATLSHITVGADLSKRSWKFKWRSDAAMIDIDSLGAQPSPPPFPVQQPSNR